MTIVNFAVVDLETTGLSRPDAEIIELGVTKVVWDVEAKEAHVSPPEAQLFRPTGAIPPEAKAVHHITEEMVADMAVITDHDLRAAVGDSSFVVAHNFGGMEGQWFTPDFLGGIRAICTMKCARRIWPREAPAFGNQVLRYWRGLPVDPRVADPPHRAGPDTHVTAHLLVDMLRTERVRDLVAWTLAPLYYPVCPLGKHKGEEWSSVPHSYLEWIVRTPDMEPDIKHAAQAEMNYRRSINT